MAIKTSRVHIASATTYGDDDHIEHHQTQAGMAGQAGRGAPTKSIKEAICAALLLSIGRRHKTRRNAVIIINVQHQSCFLLGSIVVVVVGWRIFWRFLPPSTKKYCGAITVGTRPPPSTLPSSGPASQPSNHTTSINLTNLAIKWLLGRMWNIDFLIKYYFNKLPQRLHYI